MYGLADIWRYHCMFNDLRLPQSAYALRVMHSAAKPVLVRRLHRPLIARDADVAAAVDSLTNACRIPPHRLAPLRQILDPQRRLHRGHGPGVASSATTPKPSNHSKPSPAKWPPAPPARSPPPSTTPAISPAGSSPHSAAVHPTTSPANSSRSSSPSHPPTPTAHHHPHRGARWHRATRRHPRPPRRRRPR